MRTVQWFLLFIILIFFVRCTHSRENGEGAGADVRSKTAERSDQILPGAYRTNAYLSVIREKNVGVLVNHTSQIEGRHLIDTLLAMNVNIRRIFSPEHGFEGTADAGEHVDNTTYKDTGIPVISLFGKKKKPSDEDMEGLDVLIYDIQDVGVRFYTYISTMHYAMDACVANDVDFMVLDRPNPNADYVDGPVLDTANFQSFVGMHPVPVVYGMTPAEYASMVNNEGWLSEGKRCVLSVVKMKNYKHNKTYELPVKPSPNLPNYQSVRLYPSLCFFEATPLSIGRGTDFPFQVVGYPNPEYGNFTFVPEPNEGANKPKLEGETCYGMDLRNVETSGGLTLKYLLKFYRNWEEDKPFVNREKWFNLLAGNDRLLKELRAGKSEHEIRLNWEDELKAFKNMREQYLLYRK